MREKLLKIINHYGIKHQLKYFQSEVFELNEAIFQYEEQKRVCEEFCNELHCEAERKHIAEEIADCMVMINQFMEYYNITSDEVLKVMEFKVDRQLGRMENE